VVVPATAGELDAIHAALDRFWNAVDAAVPRPPSWAWRCRFATAVAEIATNIIRHAYPNGSRRASMRLRMRLYADRVEASFADRGVAFVPPAAKDSPASDALQLPEGGYGLALVRACVDRVDHRRTPGGTNVWRLVKRFNGGGARAARASPAP
jgi:anti-sigma regulatory factor (Ser/Thr protein kinase)